MSYLTPKSRAEQLAGQAVERKSYKILAQAKELGQSGEVLTAVPPALCVSVDTLIALGLAVLTWQCCQHLPWPGDGQVPWGWSGPLGSPMCCCVAEDGVVILLSLCLSSRASQSQCDTGKQS